MTPSREVAVVAAMARLERRAVIDGGLEFANDLAIIRAALPPLFGFDEPTRLFTNRSWPQGEWRVQYGPTTDRYHIMAGPLDQRIAWVRPTLVAYWIARTYNQMRAAFPSTPLVVRERKDHL